MASSSYSRKSYHVFLSFRGPDVRNTFLGHLYMALDQSGIYTYVDSEELRKGEQITPELMKAIEDSRIAVIIFSKNYASSSWCLDELTKIMEGKKQKDLIVLPLFYKVEPREVRTPREVYKEAMAKHEKKFGKESKKVKRWNEALLEAGSLSGWEFSDGDEAGLIQNIMQQISTQLDRMPLQVAKYPVGIDSQVEELNKLLKLQSKDDVTMIGLWGQGGVGKTTLAKAIYNAVFREFQGSSFLERVRENSKDLVSLQEKLLSEVLLGKKSTIFSVARGSQLIRERLCNKKVLVILDDVDDECQLDTLAGDSDWFAKGSRIIITTRNKHMLTYQMVDHVHEVKALEHGKALELFRNHAFPRNRRIEIKSNLVDSVLHYARGLPLALVVLGSFLCGRGEHEWESTLQKLGKSPNKKINNLLKISYEALEDCEKEIFLDIACFFKGWYIGNIKKVLDSCDFPTTIGIQILIERSLISEEEGTLQMHDLIQLMGMDIAKEECRDDPGKRSRLWLYDDILDALSRDVGADATKAIVLKLQEPKEMHIGPNSFANMRKLRLLILHNVQSSFQGPMYLPNELRWFEWPHCDSIPEFRDSPKKLVFLDLQNTNIKGVLKQFKDLEYLKFINMSECKSLVHMPDLSCTPNLKELILWGCKNLESVHESIAYHGKLRYLDLQECSKLQRLPEIPVKNKSLQQVDLRGTSIKELPPSIESLVYLNALQLDDCKKLAIIPPNIYKLQNLETLSLDGCSKLIKFPKIEENSSDDHTKTGFQKLKKLNLGGCNLSELEFLKNLSSFPNLQSLNLWRNNFTNLPTWEKLYCLEELDVSDCQQLQEIPKILGNLRRLLAEGCKSLSIIPSDICGFESIYNEFSVNEEVRMKHEANEPVVLIDNSHRKSTHAPIEYLVGIVKQVEDVMDLLELEVNDVRTVGIWGKGGMGKTTLTKVIYDQISSRFESCCFLADIAATMKQLGGVRFLQSKLLSDILKEEYEVDHVAKGINFFKEVLRNMKVLIVLDDVEVRSHLHEIVGEKLDWFGNGSRIIISTSIRAILPNFISRGLAHFYEINMMNHDQALELFRKHALRRNFPIPGFDETAKDVINSVNGIPLLIKVVGSLLDRKLVEKLIAREEPLQSGLFIQDILTISYKELSLRQKEIFLDIACLPGDVDCQIASFMWHNSHFPLSDGVDALNVKSLVKIGRNNELGMHRLLREFGQQIIRTEDQVDPERRGRLCNLDLAWNAEKIKGTNHLKFVAEDFEGMPNIRFLILDHANVVGDFANIFPNLKWLQWQGCTRDFEATNFHVEKLVILDLSWSKVTEDWGGWREIKMPQLKVLNLTGCADLLIGPDLSSFPGLELLILERCSGLVKLDPSIRHLKYLTCLNLRFCNELNMLPIELGHLEALKELLIDGTSVQEIPVSMGYMEKLKIFSASNCLQLSHLPDSLCRLTALSVLLLENVKITRIPDSVGKLVKHLSLKDCRWIERLPASICNSERLELLDITGTGISKLPDGLTCFRALKVLKMDFCFIRELPRGIENLANLEELHASHCRSLKGAIPTTIKSLDHLRILKLGHSSISGLPSEVISLSCLQTLDLLQCNKIQALPELPSSLTCLRVSSESMKALPDLTGLVELKEICLGDTDPEELICASTWKETTSSLRDPLVVPVGLPKLKILELCHSQIIKLQFTHGSFLCRHLKKLVLYGINLQEVSELPSSLSVLSIQCCSSLKGLPAVGNLRILSELNLTQSAVEEIKELEGLVALEILNISYCKIRNLSGLGQLRALRSLILSDCNSLDKLPDISDLKMLNVLEVQRCSKIHDIEGLTKLTSLDVLHVSECEAENTQQVRDALKLVMARSRNS